MGYFTNVTQQNIWVAQVLTFINSQAGSDHTFLIGNFQKSPHLRPQARAPHTATLNFVRSLREHIAPPRELQLTLASPPHASACQSLNLACITHRIAQSQTCSDLHNTVLLSPPPPTSIFDFLLHPTSGDTIPLDRPQI